MKTKSHSAEFIALCDEAKSRISEISTDEVESMLDKQAPFYLIDVRESDEFEQGHLANAHFLSKGWIEAKIHEVVNDKNTTIVLYCGGGNRSALAADNLQKMGYNNVKSMNGGIRKWLRENKPMTT